jgi:hypothetical protein
MDGKKVAALIVGTAATHAVMRGHFLGDGASNFFVARADEGARALPVPVDADDPRLDEALRNAVALVDAMIAARPAAYADDPGRLASGVIGELTLGEALAKLCPIWPFC